MQQPLIYAAPQAQTRKAKAKTFNLYSWLLFVVSILLSIIGLWVPAAVVFSVALVFSIIYLAMR